MDLSVFGLGKLGVPLAAVLAFKGHNVVAVDVSEEKVNAIKMGLSPVDEPRLSSLISESVERLAATSNVDDAVLNSDVSFIIVPTPSSENGDFSLEFVLSAVTSIGRAVAEKDTFHLIVITSTVLPGSTVDQIIPALEIASGKQINVGFGVCYSPEFVALGNVVQDMLNPDIVLIGESDPKAGNILLGIYESVIENKPSIQKMNIVNAEMTKLAINTFVTTKITFANMISQICERLDEANADIVTSAVGSDSRIGTKYISPGVAYGGPCFPRDNKALSYLARSLGTTASLAEATDAENYQQIVRLSDLAKGLLKGGGCVGILGMSYKPDTDVIDDSAGFHLANLLINSDVNVIAYDPMALSNVRMLFGDSICYAESLFDCFESSDLQIITTPWSEFSDLSLAKIKSLKKNITVIDCWGIAQQLKAVSSVKYISLGVGKNNKL
ncbi:nucleotide sugar dehydrogenase [Gammaproteobacteria bacterium]|nr:nucleotide sugar dehydrogenase [Gammaproteobacteria bacterium]